MTKPIFKDDGPDRVTGHYFDQESADVLQDILRSGQLPDGRLISRFEITSLDEMSQTITVHTHRKRDSNPVEIAILGDDFMREV